MRRIAFLTLRIALVPFAVAGIGCSMSHEGSYPPPADSGSGAGATTGGGSGAAASGGSGSGAATGSSSASGSGAMAISGSQGTHSGGSSGGESGASAGTGSTSDAGAVSDLSCAQLSATACDTCCTDNHPVGEQAYQDAVDNCICGPPNGTNAVCQTQCAQTDCSSDQDASSVTGDPCDLCQTQAVDGDGGACVTQVNAACQAVVDCVAFIACEDQCP
jgi:hypothetical protein